MTQERMHYLLKQYMEGAVDEGEQEELRQAVLNSDTGLVKADIQNLIEEYALQAEPVTQEELSRSLQRVLSVDGYTDLPVINMQQKRPYPLGKWSWVAACVLLLAGGLGIYRWIADPGKPHPASHAQKTTDIGPGKNGAMLTLANGTQVLLDTIQNAVVALQGGVTAKVVNGMLAYEGYGSETVYNIMSTPKGRQFHIILPDNTKVWLNAASSIRYPTRFNGAERRVMVTGEVYFEVAKNKLKPFHVAVDNRMEVEVTGTHFNISAYNNEHDIRTTLLEGSVNVRTGNKVSSLKPGQQAQVDEEIKLLNQVDIEKVMAWKNGLFNFEDASLPETMRQLERWYDIEVVYRDAVPDLKLTGEISRGLTLNGLLTGMQKMGVQFKLEGRKLIVSAPENK